MKLFRKRLSQILPQLSGAKFFLIPLVILIAGLSSCDESSVVGLDVQPSGDLLNVGYQDTVSLVTKTVLVDSIQSDEAAISGGSGLLGKYIDPIFGTAYSAIYTQVRLATNNPPFGTSPICDSIVLSMDYSGTFYGKTEMKPQTVNVYEVTEDILGASNYFSNNTLQRGSNDLTEGSGGYTFTPRIPLATDSMALLYGVKEHSKLRIRLEQNFGQTILNNQSSGVLASNEAFQQFLKGIYITTENTSGLATGEGNILYFSLPTSKISIYYHNPTSGGLVKKWMKSYDFALSNVARFNHYQHNFSTGIDPDLATQLGATPPSNNAVVFVQSMSGLKTKIETPYMMNLQDSGAIAINKAELVIKVDTSAMYQKDSFAVPEKLVVFGINDDGTAYVLSDMNEGDTYYGGTYDATNAEYRFNLARYFQQVLYGTHKNNGLYVVAGNGSLYANRVVLGGGSSGPYQMKLNITYTKLH